MRRKSRVLIFLVSSLFAFQVFSQGQPNDSVINRISSIKDRQGQLNFVKDVLNSSHDSLTGLSIEDQILFYEHGIEIAKKSDSLVLAGSWTLNLFNLYTERLNDYEKALALMLTAQDLAKNVASTRIGGDLYMKLAAAYYNLARFDEAISFYTEALNRFDTRDSIYVADAFFFRGQAKDYRGMFLSSLEDYERARQYYEKLNDQVFVDFVQNGISILFSKYGLYKEAEKIRLGLLEKLDKQKNIQDWSILMYNRSNDFRKQGAVEQAYAIMKQIEEAMSDSVPDPTLLALLYFQLANYYAEIRDFNLQQAYFKKAEEIIQTFGILNAFVDFSKSKSLVVNAIAREEKSVSLTYAKEYLAMTRNSDNYDHKLDAKEFYAKALQLNDKPALALQAFLEFYAFKDSIFAINQANSFAYYQTIYETERKERELLNKNIEIETLTYKNTQRIRLIVSIAIVTVGFTLVLYLINKLSNLQKRQAMQAKFAQDLLISQEDERKRISKDLHDSLGQSLLLIKNKVSLLPNDPASTLVTSAIEELREISRSLHPFQLEKLGLTKAVEYLLEQIDESNSIFIDSTIEDVDSFFDKNGSVHVYRIIQEIFNNILKHAQAGGVRFELLRKHDRVVLMIEDNGIGFDFSEKFNDFKSLGLKTLKERTAALSGSIKVESEKNKGTKFKFHFHKV
jgi:signal transduction histidine kinase